MLQSGRRIVVHLGVMRLHRNICGEVERGMVCNSRGDVTLTQAACGGHCQLWLTSGRGTLTTLSSFPTGMASGSIDRKTRLEGDVPVVEKA
jgi:hypothetical protein